MAEEELKMYLDQISAIDQMLVNASEEDKPSLLETKNDLMELVNLMNEEEVSDDSPSTSKDVPDAEESSEDIVDCDDLIGMRVSATFPRHHLPISHHSAIVLEVLSPSDGLNEVSAKVLYSTPLIASMKPCSYFLSGTCRFDDKCKFSHGEVVPIRDFQEFKEPDFSCLQVGSLVLYAVEGGLWDVGRVTSQDNNEYAVKSLKTGKEVAVHIEKIIPLDAEVEEVDDAIDTHHIPNDSWSELKQEKSGDQTVGDLGSWNGGGFGLKMMQKMGYLVGQGLGKRSDGIVHAVSAVIVPKKKGVDFASEKKQRKKGMVPQKRIKKELEHSTNSSMDMDIFAFLDRKLCPKQEDQEHIRKQEQKEMNMSSDKSLGIKTIDMELKMKELKSKEKKLKEGIHRNSADSKTVSKLESSLAQVQREMTRLQGSQSRLQQEMTSRKQQKKGIF